MWAILDVVYAKSQPAKQMRNFLLASYNRTHSLQPNTVSIRLTHHFSELWMEHGYGQCEIVGTLRLKYTIAIIEFECRLNAARLVETRGSNRGRNNELRMAKWLATEKEMSYPDRRTSKLNKILKPRRKYKAEV